jgi:hypothetical protein
VILSSGHYIQILKAGIRASHPENTLHRVRFWASKADFDANHPALHTHDFDTQWAHAIDPGGFFLREVLEHHCKIADRHGWRDHGLIPDELWADGPDRLDNLSHPSMAPFKVGQ